ncbi:MAG TPA: hypothetical protein VFC06_00790, partial [Demequina sp.]|nr:hypothetical protein [Demequina sp.]
MTDTQTRSATVSRANVRGIMLDGKFTGVSRWAALDTDALTWECKKPDWFEPTVTDLRWAEESGEPRNAIFMGGDAVLLHGYALTLRDAIEDTGASFSFDRFLPGFRVKDPDQYADGLRDICKTYNICVSPQLEGHLDGLDQAVHAVAGTAADALSVGFAVPKNFASGRVLKEHQEDAVLTMAH